MNSLGTIRNGGIAGILYVVVLVGAGFLAPPPPAADEPASTFLDYLTDNRTASMIQASVTALLAIPLLPFAVTFGQRIRLLEGEHPILGTASAAGLLVAWAAAVPFMMVFGGLAWLSDGSLEEADARNLFLLVNIGYGGMLALWAGVAIFSGLALISAQGVARWLGWFGFLAALMCAVAVFGWATSGLLSPGMAIFPAYLAVSAYLLANAILMVRMK